MSGITAALILEGLARIAESQCGVQESPRGSNRGEALARYFAADNYKPEGDRDEGYAWCAAFVDWCVQEFLRKAGGDLFAAIPAPRTAAAFGLIKWALENGHMVFAPADCGRAGLWPQAGDIVVYEFSHCGILLAQHRTERSFAAVEGNTNTDGGREGYEVARRPRTFAQVRKFIRLTPRALPLTSRV